MRPTNRMEPPVDSESAKQYLSQHLEKPVPLQRYAAVKALIIYWENSDGLVEYANEANDLGEFFQGLQFDTELYKIPILGGQDSELELKAFIIQQQASLTRRMRALEAPCLLIIHYGGHGDKDDDKHTTGIGGPQERRAVWRAYPRGDPSLRWYEIQQSFIDIKFDVLLLFDCCYAAQAGRGVGASTIDEPPGRVELLAAAQGETPGPGEKDSFTTVMIATMHNRIEQYGRVSITELHGLLVHRKAQLYTIPFHLPLREGGTERSILLEKLGKYDDVEKAWRAALDVTIRFRDPLTKARLVEIVRWLRAEAPKALVAYTDVKRVLEKTGEIGEFIENKLPERSGPVAQSLGTLGTSVSEQIGNVWGSLQHLILQYKTQHNMLSFAGDEDRMAELAKVFIKRLDAGNTEILEVFQRAVMMSDVSSDPTRIDEALADPASELLGMRSRLKLRRIICCQQRPELRGKATATESTASVAPNRLMEEYKDYDEHRSSAEIADMESRIRLLANVLEAEKPESFRCLQLAYWEHIKNSRRFVYYFRIPSKYNNESTTLYDAINDLKHEWRPTLEERLTMAYRIAKAVEQWHRVDWVHQSISSHNIIFMKPKSAGSNARLDFDAPLLHGFDFARPNAKPSIARYVENIELDIYRHPDRQGEARYGHKKEHDLYSLGVVLLEIGLWRSARSTVEQRAKSLQKARKTVVIMDEAERVAKDKMVKLLMETLEESLAHYVGSDYADAVRTCLTSSFGVTQDDERKSKLLDAMDKMVLQKLGRRTIT